MSITPKILAFAGSTRRDSFNKKLVRIAAQGARAAGAEVRVIDLRDLPLPLFDEDLEREEGLPSNARALKDLFLAHHGLLIASPEYNSSYPAVLKNAIDWVSRPVPGEAPLGCFADKVAGIVAASPGALGGLRGLLQLRQLLSNIRVLVLPDQVTIGKADEAFAADGSLVDASRRQAVEAIGAKVAETTAKLLTGLRGDSIR